jgi:Dyp-type peroxidase family
MSKLNASDIQGFVLRGYNLPMARYLFLRLEGARRGRTLVHRLLSQITTGQRWDAGKPQSTLNIGFTFGGLRSLELPLATLITFPVEFQQGMRHRSQLLGDTGVNSPTHWDPLWREEDIHIWLGINGQSAAAIDVCQASVLAMLQETEGATLLGFQDAAAQVVNSVPTTGEHFGFTDGFGNPDYLGVERSSQPGQGKLLDDGKTWAPLATGELLLGYADEAGELPVAPVPHLLAANGTFMVYRKLHQNLATFRTWLDHQATLYGGGKEKLAAKLIGRWRDGTPIELSPDHSDPAIAQDPNRSTDFKYAADADGSRCPMGAHLRRVHPRDAFGFNGRLVNRRRITRRGLPYGTFVAEDVPVVDTDDRGVIFMALNASISRQFEFVQQQWIQYGNDSHLGNDKDVLMGNHGGHGRFVIPGDTTPANPPFMCSHLPDFVELRGGDYFFLPSITAIGMIALALVDPR